LVNLFFPNGKKKVILEALMYDDGIRGMIGDAPLFLETGKDDGMSICHPCPSTFLSNQIRFPTGKDML
jgi:hypothetical protein